MANSIEFLMGYERRSISDIDPTTTLLQYLREVERRTGTKEGCAEGDCGACTVVLGTLHKGAIRYRQVNSCILFLPQICGNQVITVEHLCDANGRLHPVQQALVECHGSQCGFCTPGIVMSLFALYKSNPAPTRQQILDALAGNLCRCTGYRPIVEAAERMHALGRTDHFAANEPATIRALEALQGQELALDLGRKKYFAPRTAAALAKLRMRHPDAHLVAGATDVALWVTKQHRDLDTVIQIGQIEELQHLEARPDRLEIGAAVTYSDAIEAIGGRYADFGELIRRLGSVQIRNSGTIGGNIANGSPIGDSMPALIALGATIVLRRGQKRRVLPLEEFYLDYRRTALGPGEFLEKIHLPLRTEGEFRVYKIAKRFDQDISGLLGAFWARLEGGRVQDVRIAYGGMAPIPKRAASCEQALRGRPWTESTLALGRRALEQDFAPISDMRASASYRMLTAQNLLTKFHLETSAPEVATRVLAFEPSHG
ncbi:MAG: xanthine dehydrogenase small subunit [Geminicoccales bacterium]